MPRTGQMQRLVQGTSGTTQRWLAGLLTFITTGCIAGGCVPQTGTPGNDGTSGNPLPIVVNEPPSLTFTQPNRDLVVDRGDTVLIAWIDSDPDDNAVIQLELDEDGIPGSGNEVPLLVDRFEDPDSDDDDSFLLDTGGLQPGNYIIRATISDGSNAVQVVQAPALLSVVPRGTGPQNSPPSLVVLTPALDIGLSQDDILTVTWTDADPDDNADVLVVLDLDDNPNNDDPTDPTDAGVIVPLGEPGNLNPRQEDPDAAADDSFTITINLTEIPVRPDGSPYFIRVTIDDGVNPPVHQYAPGTIRILALASGTVDLAQVGRTVMGTRWSGFNPGAQTGSRVRYVTDVDGDGTDDCIIIARFGNPRNLGNIGEAYLLLGQPGVKLGGLMSINSIGTRVPGHIFTGPVPGGAAGTPQTPPNVPATTLGITDVVAIQNMDANDGLGLPELVFGLPHVDGLHNTRDDDPEDRACAPDDLFPDGWYCDPFGRYTTTEPNDFPLLVANDSVDLEGGESMGMVSLVSSTVWTAPGAADGTVFRLDLAGQAQNGAAQLNGARWQVCIFDPFFLSAPIVGYPPIGTPGSATVNANWGQSVDVLPDVDNDQLDELIISSPRNMLDIEFWRSEFPAALPSLDGFLRAHPHLPTFGDISGEFPGISGALGGSRYYEGNVIVFFGQDWINTLTRIERPVPGSSAEPSTGDQFGTMSFPYMDPFAADAFDPVGFFCPDDTPPDTDCIVRALQVPEFFEISGEKASDELGGARSAGDFNLDGPPDIVMGAPFADDSDRDLLDVGAAYIVYLRLPVGNTRLSDLNNPNRPRPPTLRIFGDRPGDHLGLNQESVLDINGDRIDDVVIATPDADGPAGVDSGFVGVIFGGQQVTGDFVARQIGTPELRGVRFFGSNPGDQAGMSAASAGDFNGDGFGDLLIVAPGETRVVGGALRTGVVYLIFGGAHLDGKQEFFLSEVGKPFEDHNGNGLLDPGEDSNDNGILDRGLPGIVFISPFQQGTLDEAAPTTASFVGDLDGDGFADIMIGNPMADFVDPQSPSQRRTDAGEAYLIYGSNAGDNTIR